MTLYAGTPSASAWVSSWSRPLWLMAPSAGAPPGLENPGRRVHALVEVDRPHDRLEAVGQQAVEVTAARLLDALAYQQVLAQVDTARRPGQSPGAHDRHPVERQGPLAGVGIAPVEDVGGDQLQDGVAKKLQALVVGRRRRRARGRRTDGSTPAGATCDP